MIADFTWRQNDREPVFAQLLRNDVDGSPVNLQGAALSIIVRSTASPDPIAVTGPVTAVATPGATFPSQIQWALSPHDTQTIAPGVYLGNWSVVFADGTPMTFPTRGFLTLVVEESLASTGPLEAGTRPSVRDVAALLRARTKVNGGRELGTFADGQTRPGETEVTGLIDDAADEVLGKVVGIDTTLAPGSAYNAPGSRYERRIRSAIALYAAILIELSYFPEQVEASRSAAGTYQQLYDSRIRSLISEDKTGQPEGMGDSARGGAGGADSPADAAWAFPQDGGGLIGWSSRW